MLERRRRREKIPITLVRKNRVPVRDVRERCQSVAANSFELFRFRVKMAVNRDGRHERKQRRKKTARAADPKCRQRDAPFALMLRQEQRRDQKSGQHEEKIDAQITARQKPVRMKKSRRAERDHASHRAPADGARSDAFVNVQKRSSGADRTRAVRLNPSLDAQPFVCEVCARMHRNWLDRFIPLASDHRRCSAARSSHAAGARAIRPISFSAPNGEADSASERERRGDDGSIADHDAAVFARRSRQRRWIGRGQHHRARPDRMSAIGLQRAVLDRRVRLRAHGRHRILRHRRRVGSDCSELLRRDTGLHAGSVSHRSTSNATTSVTSRERHRLVRATFFSDTFNAPAVYWPRAANEARRNHESDGRFFRGRTAAGHSETIPSSFQGIAGFGVATSATSGVDAPMKALDRRRHARTFFRSRSVGSAEKCGSVDSIRRRRRRRPSTRHC